MEFNWTAEKDHHAPSGKRLVLRSPALPKGAMSPLCDDDRVAVCAQEGRKWEARFWLGYDSIKAEAGTAQRAMRLLQDALTARSVELFGGNALTFTTAI